MREVVEQYGDLSQPRQGTITGSRKIERIRGGEIAKGRQREMEHESDQRLKGWGPYGVPNAAMKEVPDTPI
jgi:hypothetical protein